MADAKDPKKAKGGKPAGRSAKKEGGKAPQAFELMAGMFAGGGMPGGAGRGRGRQ